MEPITIRSIERNLIVLIGGLCAYLGYRLFLHIPHRNDGEGKVKLPGGISIFFTRVGPGVFFALFGRVACDQPARSDRRLGRHLVLRHSAGKACRARGAGSRPHRRSLRSRPMAGSRPGVWRESGGHGGAFDRRVSGRTAAGFQLLWRLANACTVWGDLFNRLVRGFV